MYPRDVVLRSGQQLNFTIIGDRMDVRGSSQWLSSNEKVVHINRITGEAQARGEGIAEVIFKGPNTKLHTTVTVLKVNQIVVNAPAETLTNAAGPPGGYKFSVKLRFVMLISFHNIPSILLLINIVKAKATLI
jgi:nuclear pore complex protein Nup210